MSTITVSPEPSADEAEAQSFIESHPLTTSLAAVSLGLPLMSAVLCGEVMLAKKALDAYSHPTPQVRRVVHTMEIVALDQASFFLDAAPLVGIATIGALVAEARRKTRNGDRTPELEL